MGYLSQVTGEIIINPPVQANRLKSSRFATQPFGDTDVVYLIEETEEDVPEGTLVRRSATKIVPRWVDEYKAYHLLDHLIEVANEILALGSTCEGEIVRVGENIGDAERHIVTAGGMITTEKARLVWPDGSEVTL